MAEAQKRPFSFFLPLAKVEKKKDGSCVVAGYASTPTKDMDGEVVTLDAIKAALPSYMQWRNIREMHQLRAVGKAQEANLDEKGLWLTAKITDPIAVQKCVDEVYQGFSIGGRKLEKVGNEITEIDLTEISIVDRPANPDCRLSLAKRAKDGGGGYLLKTKNTTADAALALAKAAKKLAKAGPPVAKDGFSLPAKPGKNRSPRDAEIEVDKRDFSASQRAEAADTGAALPDGSFPIKNEEDLKNAISAYGRAKDKGKAKAHIIARAKALGKEGLIPEKWSKAAQAPPHSPFLNLAAAPQEEPEFLTLRKNMDAAGRLAYCFDSIRGAQRSLLMEGKREGGDKKDAKLARQLADAAKIIASVIGQKAEHEGEEAVDLSDADDLWLDPEIREEIIMSSAQTLDLNKLAGDDLSRILIAAQLLGKRGSREMSKAARVAAAAEHLKKAKASRKEAASCIKAVHEMHKASYMAKLAKAKKNKPMDDDDDEFDHQGAMEKLQKAFSAMEKVSTEMKAARGHLEKAAVSKQDTATDGCPDYEVPPGVKALNIGELAGASPGGPGGGGKPPEYPTDGGAYPGKAGEAADLRKRAPAYVTLEHAELLAKNAGLEAQLKVLNSLPMLAGGQRPRAFDMTKIGGGAWGLPSDADANEKRTALFKGVDAAGLSSEDEGERKNSVGRVIGNMLTSGLFGQSILDPTFNGAAAGR